MFNGVIHVKMINMEILEKITKVSILSHCGTSNHIYFSSYQNLLSLYF